MMNHLITRGFSRFYGCKFGLSGRHRLRVAHGTLERGVPIVVVVEQRRAILAVENTAEPVTLDVREMANQTK